MASEASPMLQQEINNWLQWDKNPTTRSEIQALVDEKNYAALEKCLLKRMAFGTAGLRAKMAAGNAFMNDLTILQTTQGIAKYLKNEYGNEVKTRGVVVGYDARHNSNRFATRVASMLVHHGIKVYKFSQITPTPFVPFAVSKYAACLGIMVTASHNPKQDNGYKVYLNNGAQINPPHDGRIASAILEDLKVPDVVWEDLDNCTLVSDPFEEVYEEYFTKLAKLSKYRKLNTTTPLKFVYTPVHGVGLQFAQQAFKSFEFDPFFPVKEQMEPDPEFSTVKYPNPEEGKGVLKLSFETAEANRCSIILANDPDADRLAVAEKSSSDGMWKVFTGNELGALFGWWALHVYNMEENKDDKKDVWMISSTVSSMILQSIAQIEGISFEDTLTGFKWMGNRADFHMRHNGRVLFAFEEAIGFMYGTNVLDKDGVSACAVMAEMATYLNSQNKTLQNQLHEIYEKYGQHVSNNSYYICHDADKIKQMFYRLRHYNEADDTNKDGRITWNHFSYPSKCGSFEISHVRDVTIGFDSRTEDNKSLLPCTPTSQMITFYFSNGANVTLRTSGTEPKIKYYSEIVGNGDAKTFKLELDQLVQEMIDEFYQPEKNGFEARST